MMQDPLFIVDWVLNGLQPNNIVVFSDLRTDLQDNYETIWNNTFATCCTVLDKENQYILGSRNGYNYLFTIQRRLKLLPDGTLGYGKWLKDW